MLYGVVGWNAEVMMMQTSLLVDVPVLFVLLIMRISFLGPTLHRSQHVFFEAVRLLWCGKTLRLL